MTHLQYTRFAHTSGPQKCRFKGALKPWRFGSLHSEPLCRNALLLNVDLHRHGQFGCGDVMDNGRAANGACRMAAIVVVGWMTVMVCGGVGGSGGGHNRLAHIIRTSALVLLLMVSG